MKIVKVYGDSISLPRPQDGISFGKEYGFLVYDFLRREVESESFYLNRSIGGAKVKELFDLYSRDLIYFNGKGILIIQCGVVDCAPRPVPMFIRELISIQPDFIKWRIVKFLHNNRSRILKAGFGTRATPPTKFRKVYKKWLSYALEREELVIVINIAPNTDEIENHSPGFRKSIEEYNRIIKEIVDEKKSEKLIHIDVFSKILEFDPDRKFIINQKDGHHITLDGHKVYAEEIEKKIRDYFKKG